MRARSRACATSSASAARERLDWTTCRASLLWATALTRPAAPLGPVAPVAPMAPMAPAAPETPATCSSPAALTAPPPPPLPLALPMI